MLDRHEASRGLFATAELLEPFYYVEKQLNNVREAQNWTLEMSTPHLPNMLDVLFGSTNDDDVTVT